MNILVVILLLIIFVLIIIVSNKLYNKKKENFEDYKIKTDTVNSLSDLKTSTGKIFVGADDAERNEAQQISKINNDVTLGTNNTLFIRNGITLSPDKLLNIDYLRKIKFLPYHFDDKICIEDECINKNNIKYMKGKIPFSIITFTDLQPFQIFSKKEYSGWTRIVGTKPMANINLNGNTPMMSIKITGDLYKVTAYSEPNFKGERHDITASSGDLTGLFPKGVKIINVSYHFFPLRALPFRFLKIFHKVLDRYLPFMIFITIKKIS